MWFWEDIVHLVVGFLKDKAFGMKRVEFIDCWFSIWDVETVDKRRHVLFYVKGIFTHHEFIETDNVWVDIDQGGEMRGRGLWWFELNTAHLEGDSFVNILPEESVLLEC